MNNIVTIAVSQQVAPAPSTLQSSAALVSQGGTTEAADSRTLCQTLQDVKDIIKPPGAITSAAWLANVVTITTTDPHGMPNGAVLPGVIAGFTPSAYNGSFDFTVTGTSTFTYPLVGDPGADSVQGTYVLDASAELLAMATTWFAQGSADAVYVVELGPSEVDDGVSDLDDYLTENPLQNYIYVVPDAWADSADFVTLATSYAGLTAKTYFATTMDGMNYPDFEDIKSVIGMVEAPAAPATENDVSAVAHRVISYRPSAANRVPPTAFAYLFGVTDYPPQGNSALFAAFKAAGVNIVGTGAEGGISNKVLFWGTAMDQRDITYWYAVDWLQINLDAGLANEIINGSNNPAAPLYYDQDGINRLQARAQAIVNAAVSFGMVSGNPEVQAVPFAQYVAENPSDYASGTYNGLSVTVVIGKGFKSITFQLVVSDLPTT